MNRIEFAEKLTKAVEEYLLNEEEFGDDSAIEITSEGGVRLVAEPEDEETRDYYPVMDFVSMSVANPGKWEIDREAINEVAAEYCPD